MLPPNGTLHDCAVWISGTRFGIFPECGPFSDNPDAIIDRLKSGEKNLREHIDRLNARLATMQKAIENPPDFRRLSRKEFRKFYPDCL